MSPEDAWQSDEFDALVDACGAAVLVLDRALMVLSANAEAAKLFGMDVGQMVGRPLIQATLTLDLQDLAAGLTEAAEREVISVGPRRRSVIARARATEDRVLLVLRDVTDLRRLETMRKDFVANVSHELRTPLASVRAMAETLLDGARDDPAVAERFLETIVRETDRLARIAEDLLVLSGSESGPPARSEVDLSGMVAEAVSRAQPQAEGLGLTLMSQIETGVRALAARDQIEQVLVNLIDNAIKYTQPGGEVSVTLQEKGPIAEVAVRDTGIGIMSEHLPRIFERFYRVDRARSRQSGGTGLGLSIVKHIVESHGGQVRVESEFKRGSTFTIELPLS